MVISLAKKQPVTRFTCSDMKKLESMIPAGISDVAYKIDRALCGPGKTSTKVALTSKECKNDLRVLTSWFDGKKDKQGDRKSVV